MPKVAPELTLVTVSIDKKAETPLFQQLYDGIRKEILKGTIRSGQRLPASRQLADQLGISRNVVTLAFEQLMLEGYLQGKTGSGTFVSSTIPDTHLQPQLINEPHAVRKKNLAEFVAPDLLTKNAQNEEIIPFQNAVPAFDLFPFKTWSRLASRAYKNMSKFHLGYSDAMGYAPLRENIASYLRTSRGVKCEADQILIVNGAQQAFSLCSQVLLKPNDEVVVEDPGYNGAKSAFVSCGARLRPVPVQSDGLDVEYLDKHGRGAKMVYVTPAHQYPMGGTLSLAKRLELLNWASEHESWILEDDYDSELRYTGRPLASLQGLDQHNRVIYIGTFSKVVFPALRVAYIVLPTRSMAEQFKYYKAVLDRQFPIMEQIILNSFVEEGYFARHLRKMRIAYDERQKMLIKAIDKDLFPKLRVQEQAAGMHLLGWLPESQNDTQISALLAKNGILVNALSEYTMKFRQKPALILGYTAFNKFRIRHYVQRMNGLMKF